MLITFKVHGRGGHAWFLQPTGRVPQPSSLVRQPSPEKPAKAPIDTEFLYPGLLSSPKPTNPSATIMVGSTDHQRPNLHTLSNGMHHVNHGLGESPTTSQRQLVEFDSGPRDNGFFLTSQV